MSATITVEEAQAHFREVLAKLAPGEEVVVVDNNKPVATIIGRPPELPARPAPGLGKGTILYMAPDFDAPLEDFKEHME